MKTCQKPPEFWIFVRLLPHCIGIVLIKFGICNGMVWYVMVWFGICNGMVWYDIECAHGMVWYDYGVVLMFPPLCPYPLPTLHSNGDHGRGHDRGSNRATLQNRAILWGLLESTFFLR